MKDDQQSLRKWNAISQNGGQKKGNFLNFLQTKKFSTVSTQICCEMFSQKQKTEHKIERTFTGWVGVEELLS
jgi:hypothetical protein